MDAEGFRALTERLGLKPDTVATLGGTSLRAVYRYLNGTRRVPPALVSYLGLYEKLTPDERAAELVAKQAQVAP